MQPQDPAAPSNPPAQPGFARRAAEALKKAVWRSEPAEPSAATGVATVATLSDRVKKYLPSSDLQKIRDAFRFSDEAHLGQFRRSGAPYITHPLAVAEILTDWHLDGAAIQAALLHDVLEDSGTPKQQLVERFGATGGRPGRRCLQAGQAAVLLDRAGAGRELPQDAAGDGARRARHADQARRSPAQHAHARRGRTGKAAPHRARNARDLRADRASARTQQPVPRTRRPELPAPAPDALPGAAKSRALGARQPARSAEQDPAVGAQGADGRQAAGRGLRPRKRHCSASTARWSRRTCRSHRCSTSTVSASSSTRWPSATSRSAHCTGSTSRCQASSRTTSRSRRSTAISRCTPR